jgi:D-galactarolactone cycloisomerase
MDQSIGAREQPRCIKSTIATMSHFWGTGIAIAASLQLLAVLPTHTPNSLAPLEPMLEFDCTEHPIRQAVLTRPLEPADGTIRVPDGPGLGIEVDRAALARFAA